MAKQIELQANTATGARLVSCAESLAAQLAAGTSEIERSGRYPIENITLLKQAGYFVAPVPQQCGGLGVESVHDLLVASSRLARGDPSITIGLNMHLLVVYSMTRRWRLACHRADQYRAAAFADSLEQVVRDGVVIAAAVSEPGQNLTLPSTRALHTESGWSLNGHKIFCTMAPAATMFLVAVTFEDSNGTLRYGYAQVSPETPGVVIHDDWDALGMRASGSNSVSFHDVRLPDSALRGGFPAGSLTVGFMERNLANGLFHASASLGIAEAAHCAAVERLARNGGAERRARAQTLAAENVIDLSAMRAVFGRAGDLVDGFQLEYSESEASFDETATIFAEVQAAKTFVNEVAVRVVDRALTLSGGAGYMTKDPLSRAYRDVRAGAFMQPLGSVRAYDFIGQVALGLPPTLT